MRTSDFDFDLPDELIAQRPPAERGTSRLLVLPRSTGPIEHTTFVHLGDYLGAGDLLVVNDTRVFPARLIGRRVPTGGAVECLLLSRSSRDPGSGIRDSVSSGKGQPPGAFAELASPESRIPDPEIWEALMHPGQKLKPGAEVVFEQANGRLRGEVLARHFHGRRTIRLWTDDGTSIADAVEQIGHIPLPPYINRPDEPTDRVRYQTVYAHERGSVAAPTAGLHFTEDLIADLTARGVEQTSITLHVGYGTFKPVRVEDVDEHVVDPESFTVSPAAAERLSRALRERRRIIAVGTTTTRALESLTIDPPGVVRPASGATQLFIHPGHRFQLVSGLVTNFHLPRSSLLMLVAAFTGRERILNAYREAVTLRYRFYSYGDAMLII